MEFAELNGMDIEPCREAKQVAAFYPHDLRNPHLNWKHHREAMQGADGDVAVAQTYLDLAFAEDLSVGALRKAIRKDKATEKQPANDPGPPSIPFERLFDADAWAVGGISQIRAMDESERDELRGRIANLIALVKELEG
jgi:hypothetical protein